MTRYIIRRLLWGIVLLFGVSFVTFVIFYLLPSANPALLRAGHQPTAALIKSINHQLGLDKPWYVQYYRYMKALVLHFNFGYSYEYQESVRTVIFRALPATISLALGAAVIWIVIGVGIGTISAIRRRSRFDRATMGTALVAISAPTYWLGLLALFLFSTEVGKIPIFPGAGSYTGLTSDPVKWFTSLIMPWLVLAAGFAAIYARLLRGNLIEVMSEDYIRTARAKGLPERTVIIKHGVRSAITPLVSAAGVDIGILLGGVILVETVFTIPGMGRLAYQAILQGDLPMIQGTVLLGAFFIVIANLVVDIAYAFIDPRGAVFLMPLLEVEDLRVEFVTDDGVVHAVDGISYAVDTGRTLGIVGESGSGKTVSSLTTMGLTRSRTTNISGKILFEGKDLLQASGEELRQIRGNEIAMIFQDPLSSLHPFYKVGTQLIEAIRIHRDVSKAAARDRVIDLFELVGIPDPHRRVDQYPHEFSGGMRQRAMIAMALSNEPKLLIADEPTTALDVTVQAQILALIADLQKRLGMAVIIITHDLGVVAEIADEIGVMYAGRIVEHASAERIFAAPQHPYTWGLLESIPRLDKGREEDLIPIAGRPPSLILRPSGCFFHPRCPYVRERHKHEDPRLEPVPGESGHEVACLLEPEVRMRIWQGLQGGESPASLRRIAEPAIAGQAAGAEATGEAGGFPGPAEETGP